MHDAPFRRGPMARRRRWTPSGWWAAVRSGNKREALGLNTGRDEERAGQSERKKTMARGARIAARGKGGRALGWKGGRSVRCACAGMMGELNSLCSEYAPVVLCHALYPGY